MPHTVQLVKERGAAGFAAVTVCMDDPDNADAVKQLLAARGAAATINLISRDGGGSKAMEAFEVPGGALPHYRVYDRQGKLHASFELDPGAREQFGVAHIDKSVAELLSD